MEGSERFPQCEARGPRERPPQLLRPAGRQTAVHQTPDSKRQPPAAIRSAKDTGPATVGPPARSPGRGSAPRDFAARRAGTVAPPGRQLSRTRTFPGERPPPSRVHELHPEIQIRLKLIVRPAAQFDVRRFVPTTLSEGLPVMKLQEPGRPTTFARVIDKDASPTVTQPDLAPHRRGNPARPRRPERPAGSFPVRPRAFLRRPGARAVGQCRFSLQRLGQQCVDRPAHHRSRAHVRLAMSQQVLQTAQFLVSLLVHRDLDLESTRGERPNLTLRRPRRPRRNRDRHVYSDSLPVAPVARRRPRG